MPDENFQGALDALGRALREARNERGLTQREVADAAGVFRSYVSEIEGGRRNPSVVSILKICRALNVPIRRLFDDVT